jgi:hypothetical protein
MMKSRKMRWAGHVARMVSSRIIRMTKSRRMRLARHVARLVEKSNAYRLLVGKPEGKRPLGRRTRRWVNNIRIDACDSNRQGRERDSKETTRNRHTRETKGRTSMTGKKQQSS